MADNVANHHLPKTGEEKSDHWLLDCFVKKDEDKYFGETDCKDEKNESLLAKLHISDSTSSSSGEECEDGQKKKKDKTLKEKVEKKIEEDKVKIEEAREKALELKEKTIEKIEDGKKNTQEFKEKIEETIRDYKEKNDNKHKGDTCVPVTKYEEVVVMPDHQASPPPSYEVVVSQPEPTGEIEEKKGFIEKIKDKLPGGNKKAEEEYTAPVAAQNTDHHVDAENEHKEKKGILEMIKEKLPGYHSKSEEEKKE